MKEMPVPLCVRYYRLTQDRSVLLVELTHLYTDRFSEELLMSELLGHGEDVRDRFHDYQLAMRDLESGDHKEAAEFWDKFSKEAEEKKTRSLSSVYDSGPWKKMYYQDRYLLRMGKELSAAVREYAARARVTPSEMILLDDGKQKDIQALLRPLMDRDKRIRCRMPLFYGSICPGKSVPARHRLCKEPRRLPGLRSECRNKGLAGTNKD